MRRSSLLLSIALLLLLAALGCSDGETCPDDPIGLYQLTWDQDSLDDRPECLSVETATARIDSEGSTLRIRYRGFGPFALTEGDDGELTWTEDSSDGEFSTSATYRIVREGCNVSGDGVFTRTFAEDGSTCNGVATITGYRTD